MSSPTSFAESRPEFRTAPGALRIGLVIGVSALALTASFRTGLPTLGEWLLAGLVALVAGRALVRMPRHRFRLPADGPAALNGVSGVPVARAVTPLFVSFEVRAPDRRRDRALVFRDELPTDDFRELLVVFRNR
jgi:hypothetical protein